MSRLDSATDWLSPIVVKEVRQMVRSREFNLSLGLGLLAGLIVAFAGSADSVNGNPISGAWIFGALTSCLGFIGLAVAPLGAFSSLRNERAERTLDLVTLTALTPRRLVIGKLMAQGVKLLTLFSCFAPFIVMSFLLGGVDILTILISLASLFMWSLWACAACIFLSSFTKSRALSSLILGAGGLLVLVFGVGRFGYLIFMSLTYGPGYSGGGLLTPAGLAGSDLWWFLAVMSAICVMTMVNLVLLAENRLLLPTEDRISAVRVGFFVQFLMTFACVLLPLAFGPVSYDRSDAAEALTVFGLLQLAAIALFSITENPAPPRRLLRAQVSVWRRRLLAFFRPGGGAGGIYVLAQGALLALVVSWLAPGNDAVTVTLVVIAYVLLFTGLPVCLAHVLAPGGLRPEQLRWGTIMLFAVVILMPDILHYLVTGSDLFNARFAFRHLINPFRVLDNNNWEVAQRNGWDYVVYALGLAGLFSYLVVILIGRKAAAAELAAHSGPAAASGGGGNGAAD
jgi:hypothetical protein